LAKPLFSAHPNDFPMEQELARYSVTTIDFMHSSLEFKDLEDDPRLEIAVIAAFTHALLFFVI
jgi:hypothetical protein